MTSWVTSNMYWTITQKEEEEVVTMITAKLIAWSCTILLQGMQQDNDNADGSLDVQHQGVEDELQSSRTPTTSIPKK